MDTNLCEVVKSILEGRGPALWAMLEGESDEVMRHWNDCPTCRALSERMHGEDPVGYLEIMARTLVPPFSNESSNEQPSPLNELYEKETRELERAVLAFFERHPDLAPAKHGIPDIIELQQLHDVVWGTWMLLNRARRRRRFADAQTIELLETGAVLVGENEIIPANIMREEAIRCGQLWDYTSENPQAMTEIAANAMGWLVAIISQVPEFFPRYKNEIGNRPNNVRSVRLTLVNPNSDENFSGWKL